MGRADERDERGHRVTLHRCASYEPLHARLSLRRTHTRADGWGVPPFARDAETAGIAAVERCDLKRLGHG